MAQCFNYLAPLDEYLKEKPYHSRLPFLNGLRRTNIVGRKYEVEVYNIRGYEDHFTLEESGFRFLPFPVKMSSWTDQSVQSEYLPMVSTWLAQYFACRKAEIYSYNVSNDIR